MSRWEVRKIGVMWSVEDVGGNNYDLFHRWDEAMHYANRMARITTIEDRSGALCALTATVISQHRISLRAGDDVFILASHEWKPLAKFLLAAAKHQENK